MCVRVCKICVAHACLVPVEARRGCARSPGTGITSGCKIPCRYLDSNPDPLEEQSVFLTAEPALQP